MGSKRRGKQWDQSFEPLVPSINQDLFACRQMPSQRKIVVFLKTTNMFASGYEDSGSFFCDKKATLIIGLLFAMDLSAGDYAVANLCPDSKLQKSLVTSQT